MLQRVRASWLWTSRQAADVSRHVRNFMRVVAHTLCNAICAPSPPKARCLPLIRFLRQASQPLGDAAMPLGRPRKRPAASDAEDEAQACPCNGVGQRPALAQPSASTCISDIETCIQDLQMHTAHPKSHNRKVLRNCVVACCGYGARAKEMSSQLPWQSSRGMIWNTACNIVRPG